MTNRLKGLTAGLLIVAILAVLPLTLLAVGVPTLYVPSAASLWDLLLQPDDGSLIVAVLWAAGWVLWAVLALAVLTEVVAALRRVRAPRIAGLRMPQSWARQLVSTAALLFVTTGTLNPAHAHAAPPASSVITAVAPEDVPAPGDASPVRAARTLASSARTYVVQPGDSLWKIAQQQLGSGERYTEIVDLNHATLGGTPNFLQTGWSLTLPSEATDSPSTAQPAGQIQVQKGDTLSKLAATHLGDPERWTDIYDASTQIIQDDGRRLSDPDQIDVGWALNLPTATTPTPEVAAVDAPAATDVATDSVQTPDSGVVPVEPTTGPAAPSTEPPAVVQEAAPASDTPANAAPVLSEPVAEDGVDVDAPPAASWLVPGLIGGGLLVGSMALALVRRRAVQARFRRPGKAIPAAPPALAPLEKTVMATAATAATVETLDQVLAWTAARHVATGLPIPPLVAVDLDADRVTLHLAEEDTVVEPWLADDSRQHWTLQLADLPDLETVEVGSAAWPQLVTIGRSDAGATWLLNAEEVGTLRLTGDRDFAQDFARYLVAELALNPWARDVRVDCINTCAELTAIDPIKVRHHTSLDPIAETLADVLHTIDRLAESGATDLGDARAADVGEDLWPSRMLILAEPEQTPELGALLDTIATQVGRTGTSVLLTRGEASTEGVELRFTPTGRVQLPTVGLDLVAVGLTSDEASGCAALLAVADQVDDVDVPAMQTLPGEESWRTYANEAGQITDPHIRGREPGEEGRTLIAVEDEAAVLATAATTIEDLDVLAPTIPAEVATTIERVDPTLDADLEEWANPGPRPRLSVLGPVVARCGSGGNPHAVAKRKPYHTELLAYLASRTAGATIDQVADAMGVSTKRVRTDISVLRDWLGKNTATGQLHIPEANKSNAAKLLGSAAYEVNDLLFDADLFRRLRVRGEASGPAGLDDLKRALKLVTGQPFDQIRNGGGAWLVDNGQPHFLTIAVVDVAHMTCTLSLARGDLRDARAAAEIAILAAPQEQIPRLDLAAVAAAEGLTHEATLIARATIDGDTSQAPVELSSRADEILSRHGWLNGAQAS